MPANQPIYKVVTLTLTSPHMKDGRGALKGSHMIRDLQYLLNNNSKNARNKDKSFGDYYGGSLDGEYGPYTASAVRLTKHFLGYPTSEVNEVAGPVLEAYLRGEKKLPLTYVTRRNLRLKQAQKMDTVREKAFAEAVTKLGVHESPPFSNRVEFGYWYGIIGAWCAMFVTWSYVLGGSKRLVRGQRYAYVPYIRDDAAAGRNGLHLTTNPVRGDIVCFQTAGHSTPNHTGLFDHWIDRSRGTFATVEGNTGISSFDNGGAVERGVRYTYMVAAFVRVVEA